MKVLVFARAPVPGRCKTRLMPRLGPGGAARLQKQLTQRTVRIAMQAGAEVELWCAPDSAHGLFTRLASGLGLRRRRQPTGDLGRRMALALAHGPALLVGTDCPSLSAADLRSAWQALASVDCVLQPSTDGGYVLVGARRLERRALAGIAWSSGRELAQTRQRFRRLGLRWRELPARPDLDTPADFRRARIKGTLTFLRA